MTNIIITVFTATYNRAHTLHRVYESLSAQSFRDFEWLIVDDGSTDNTAEIVAQWQQVSSFPIRYVYQENSGMYAAIDRAALLAQGEFFVCLDSDDRCVPDALEKLLARWYEIPINQRESFTGVSALAVDQFGNPVGKDLAYDPTDATHLEMLYVYRRRAETFRLVRTEVVREFPYPVIPNLRYLPELIALEKAARRYTTRFVNDRLRIYYLNEGTDNTSGSGAKSWRRLNRMALGLAYWHQQVLLTQIDYFRYDPLRFLVSASHFVRFSFMIGNTMRTQWNALPAVSARILWLVAFVPGTLLHLRDRYLLPNA